VGDDELFLSPARLIEVQALLELMEKAAIAVTSATSSEGRRQAWRRYFGAKTELDMNVPPVTEAL
jgi:hypothetical protein